MKSMDLAAVPHFNHFQFPAGIIQGEDTFSLGPSKLRPKNSVLPIIEPYKNFINETDLGLLPMFFRSIKTTNGFYISKTQGGDAFSR